MMKLVIYLLVVCCVMVQAEWVKEMENKDNYEGDIVLDPDEYPQGANAFASIKGGRWPGNTVPYTIDGSSNHGTRSILAAIDQYHKHTCLRFKRRTNERAYINFHSRGRGCSSPVGYRSGRKNDISLGSGCMGLGTVMHEMGHSIGLYHEQSRPDRDSYVTIYWNNITPDMRFNFDKHTIRTIDSLGTSYDYSSMMHYGQTAFGNGKVTIRTKNSRDQNLIGNRKGFSAGDIKQINLMYKCNGGTGVVTEAPTVQRCSAGGDLDSRCGGWAARGYCKSNDQNYLNTMRRKCCKSCGFGECRNGNARCDEWAKRGECSKNSKYMLNVCARACLKC